MELLLERPGAHFVASRKRFVPSDRPAEIVRWPVSVLLEYEHAGQHTRNGGTMDSEGEFSDTERVCARVLAALIRAARLESEARKEREDACRSSDCQTGESGRSASKR